MILIIYNEKGGVGKTTNSIHIGASIAALGRSVLLVDFDPQCDLTKGSGISAPKYTVKNLLDGTGKPSYRTRSENFTVLAGDPLLDASSYSKFSLRNALAPLQSHFQYIIIDCPPQTLNSHHLTLPELALNAGDQFIIPLEAGSYAVANSDKVLAKVVSIIKPNNPKLQFTGFVFGKINSAATKRNRIYMTRMEEKSADYVFSQSIRFDSEIEYAIENGMTIFQHEPNCRAANDYMTFSKSLLEKLEHV